ncbi:MAG: transglutaminase-like cysteine peptidase [Roseibium sp.]|uniref:transglutaminase-like cysteine peptidase n=1 Tax=Roseibium sp. TaxID=1936156 RepID=UPI0026239B31|nr:transglutaminase-like cysteine peptidase [Roseibium sp.]MCV0429843.1 transglutaminase-like cysteine peptidase [Roseibium sp.]
MKRVLLAFTAAVIAFSFLPADKAEAFSLGGSTRVLGTSPALKKERQLTMTRAPKAYNLFCMNNPVECRSGGSDIITANYALMQTLNKVNRGVNRSIKWVRDRNNVWKIGNRTGDCEDYALTKRSRLMKLGVPAAALRMAIVKNQKGQGHAVLVVKTTKGDLVLDNVNNNITLRESTAYRWIGIASANPYRWQLL